MHFIIGLRDGGQRGPVAGIVLEHVLKGLDRLVADLGVFGGITVGDVQLPDGGGQVKLGVEQRRVQRHGLLEMVDGGLKLGVAVRGHALVELVARLELIAPARYKRQQQHPAERRELVRSHLGSSMDSSCK